MVDSGKGGVLSSTPGKHYLRFAVWVALGAALMDTVAVLFVIPPLDPDLFWIAAILSSLSKFVWAFAILMAALVLRFGCARPPMISWC